MSLCGAFQEDLIANDFLRVGANCANVTCQCPITNHSHKPAGLPVVPATAENRHMKRLYSAVMHAGHLDRSLDEDLWTLKGNVSWSEDEVFSLLIRNAWVSLRGYILDDSRLFPLCILLQGKSGRGKSVFLKHLIFFILLSARECGHIDTDTPADSHLYAPLIVYVGRTGEAHYISLDGVFTEWVWEETNNGKPHYYFSDNVDILSGATLGTRVTMALSSGDAIVMVEYRKRIDDVGGTISYMPSLDLAEMQKLFAHPSTQPATQPAIQPAAQSATQPERLKQTHKVRAARAAHTNHLEQSELSHQTRTVPLAPPEQLAEHLAQPERLELPYPDTTQLRQTGSSQIQPGVEQRRHRFAADEISFRFDVIGGNPRRMKDKNVSVARTSYHYKLVSAVVERVFPDQTAARKQWALDLVCTTLEGAQGLGGRTQTDSSLFREFVVSGSDFTGHEEVFSSTFMGMVAAAIEEHKDALKELSIVTLFGASGYGNLFGYQMHQTLLAASLEDEYFCWSCDGKNHVSLRLGGGMVKLVRTIGDLNSLVVGNYGMPTVPNYAIVDSVRVTEHTQTTGWIRRHTTTTTRKVGINATISDRHEGKVTKLQEMIDALGTVEAEFWIVYVVPFSHLHLFKFPTNLGAVKLFVTASHPTTEAAIRGAMGAKKRKASVWW